MTLLLTGDPLDAETALAWGLVTAVVEDTVLQHEAAQLAERMAAKAPLAIAATKRAVNRGADRPLKEALAAEAEEFSTLFTTEDAREGVSALLEKRTPHWSGR
jgi:enoyl-CoA hydratase/carnithine racemase